MRSQPTPEARHRRRLRTPVLVVTALAWAATLAVHLLPATSGHHLHGARQLHTMQHTNDMPGMPGMSGMLPGAGTGSPSNGSLSTGSLQMFLLGWPFMLTAMMAPLLVPVLRHVHARSLPSRRRRTLTLLVAAYVAVWTAGGLVLFGLAAAVRAGAGSGAVAIGSAIAAAALWQLSPLKQRCLNRHHVQPLIAAFGRPADRDALRFGGTHALWCLGSCWALMMVPLLFDRWHLAAMAVVTLYLWAESFDPPAPPAWCPRLPVTAVRVVSTVVKPG